MALGNGPSGSSGTSLSIGTTASNAVTDTYTLVGSVATLSAFGIEYSENKFEDLTLGTVQKAKGPRDDGLITVGLGQDVSDSGQIAINVAVLAPQDYNFKVTYNDAVAAASATGVTATAASPGVFTDAAHGLLAGDPVKFVEISTAVLPTGIVSGTTYYVKTVLTSSTYTVSATSGGSVINTTGSPSGTYTRTTVPASSYRLFKAKVMSYKENPGSLASFVMADVGLSLRSGSLVNASRVPLVAA